ncbi:hypothetical protein CHS0354_027799 [Potamilus streckersoni]|uniref:C1q domain-containing protein n=1 Tax=Potamilus streckersoni TaxID=2493646 RepID=A0AAE0T111_9BIVA|nr:hypothetical protein CHS0354_027799 [Potamilus streckersoni]
MAMFPIHLLLLLTISAFDYAAILENVAQADLDAVRIRLEEEKAKRLLLQNDVEILMLKVEELKRGYSQLSNDNIELAGNITFVSHIGFTVRISKTTLYVPGQIVIFDNVMVNEGNFYDSSTGRFRAPYRGLYSFSVTALKQSATDVHLLVMKDNDEIGRLFSGTSSYDSGSVTVVTVMDKGQTVYIKTQPNYTETVLGDYWATFTGLLHDRYN